MSIEGIQLTWVVVKNLENAIKFYTESLGFTLKEHVPEFGWAELEGTTGSRLGLAQEQDTPNEWDGTHFKAGSNGVVAITVKDIDAVSRDYVKKGVRLLGKVMEVPGEVKLQTFQDPDGNVFQLAEVLRKP